MRQLQYSVLAVAAAVALGPPGVAQQQVIRPAGYSATYSLSSAACGEGCSSSGCNACACGNGACGSGCRTGSCDGDCDGGCDARSSWNDFATNWCGRCGPIGRGAAAGCRVCSGVCQHCGTRAAPDSGFNAPARLPINRDGIWYQSYYPGAFYGNPGGGFLGGYPMVYQPTDTTQLGFGYAKVPTWRRRPEMIPPVPLPSDFHARVCPTGGSCFGGYAGGCPTGACQSGGYAANIGMQPAAVAWSQPVPYAAPVAQPRPQVRQASAPTPQKRRNWFRLTGLRDLFD